MSRGRLLSLIVGSMGISIIAVGCEAANDSNDQTASCPVGQTACGVDGACVDVLSNALHCGQCGLACPTAATCQGGQCSCDVGRTNCSGACIDTLGNGTNCGGCGVICPEGTVCSAGSCTTSCTAGTVPCGSSCVDVHASPDHCGGCNVACGGGQSCTAGVCGCPAGQMLCGAACTTVGSDGSNCGACGVTCGPGQACQAGTCVGGLGTGGSGTGGIGSGGGGTGGVGTGGVGTGGGGTGGVGTGGQNPGGDVFTIDASLSGAIGTVGIVQWSTSVPIESAHIDFGRDASAWEYQAPVPTAASSGNRTLLLGMKPSTTYSFQVVAQGGGQTYTSAVQELTTQPVRSGLPQVSMSPPGASEGFTIACIFGFFGDSWTFIIDQDGDHVWWHQSSGGADCVRARMSYDGQHMWIANGNVPGPSSGTLVRVSMDGEDERNYPVPNRHHDVAVLPDETVVYIEYENGNAQGCDVVKTLNPETEETGTVYQVSQANNGSQNCHSNAINWWPDQNLFTLSVLNWNSIIAFTREGSLQWVLGGDASTYSGASWRAQHNHHLLDNSLMLFNNQGTNGSSVLEFQLNGTNAQLVWEYSSGQSTNTMGDAKRLSNGHTIVTYSNQGVIHEVDSGGQLIQEITTDQIGYTVRRQTLYGAPPPYAD